MPVTLCYRYLVEPCLFYTHLPTACLRGVFTMFLRPLSCSEDIFSSFATFAIYYDLFSAHRVQHYSRRFTHMQVSFLRHILFSVSEKRPQETVANAVYRRMQQYCRSKIDINVILKKAGMIRRRFSRILSERRDWDSSVASIIILQCINDSASTPNCSLLLMVCQL